MSRMGNQATAGRRQTATKSFLSRQATRSSGALYKFKLGHGPVSVHKPLNYSCIRDYLQGLVADISPFDTHSLRAGGASAAANAGVPDGLFQRHGRWKSISTDGYVGESLISRLPVSKKLGFNFLLLTSHFPFFFSIRMCILED